MTESIFRQNDFTAGISPTLESLHEMEFLIRRRVIVAARADAYDACQKLGGMSPPFPFVVFTLPWTFLGKDGNPAPIREGREEHYKRDTNGDLVYTNGVASVLSPAVIEIPPAGFNLSEDIRREMLRIYVTGERDRFREKRKPPFTHQAAARWVSQVNCLVWGIESLFPQYRDDDEVTPWTVLERVMAAYDHMVRLGGYPAYANPNWPDRSRNMPNPVTGAAPAVRECARITLASSLLKQGKRHNRFTGGVSNSPIPV